MRIRAFIADDHAIVRDGLRRLLEAHDIEVVGETADGRGVLRAPALARADVLLLDLSLPRVSGMEVLRRTVEMHPRLRVIVLSMYPAEQFATRCLAEGAWAYLDKTASGKEVLDLVHKATSRREPTSEVHPRPALPHDTLSPREFQIFVLIAQGRTVSEIAAELDVTKATVSTHLGKVREKVSARTNADVVAYAYRAGLVG